MSSPTKQKHFSPPKFYSLKRFLCFLTISTTLLLLLQFHSLSSSSSSSRRLDAAARAMLRDSVTFLPLKDLRFADAPMSGHTWFMSSMNDTFDGDGEAEHLHFPSKESSGRVLCLAARDVSDGAKNSYALAWREALPRGATLYLGLTFVSDTYYDYANPWHGLTAVAPFAAWHQRRRCAVPARWVLFHRGELRTEMGPWVRALAEAAIGSAAVEGFEGAGGGPACFEEAVVFRRNMGAMSRARAEEVIDAMRCRARARCDVVDSAEVGAFGNSKRFSVRITLLLRTGARSFKNESAVVAVFEAECRKVNGCRVKVERPDNLTFCDQVKLLSETDILVTPHGAQMTNMIFMNKNSSVMEVFPNGFKELAGEGQYVYQWLAKWSAMRHRGSWYDPEAVPCMTGDGQETQCSPYKSRQIGHDEAYFARWAARVLRETKEYKLSAAAVATNSAAQQGSTSCQCLQT